MELQVVYYGDYLYSTFNIRHFWRFMQTQYIAPYLSRLNLMVMPVLLDSTGKYRPFLPPDLASHQVI